VPATETVDAILRGLPGPVTLYPSRRRLILILFGCAVFDAIGIKMVADGAPSGWPGLIFFGLCTISAAGALLPGAVSLKVDQDGFQETRLFRPRGSRWQDVSGFGWGAIGASKFVVYDDVNLAGRAFTMIKLIAMLNIVTTGKNAGLANTYGLSAADLARVMTQWRERALALLPRA
jgi:hypothetical protein